MLSREMSKLQLNDDLYSAICRSISAVEPTGDVAELSAHAHAACDSLHALAPWFQSNQHAFGLLLRLTDKRVLATTCDHDPMSNESETFDDAAARSAAVTSLVNERLHVRARPAEFLSSVASNCDVTRWFEERKFSISL